MYKECFRPSSYYEPEGYDDDKDAYVYVGQLNHMRDHFSAILSHLYGKGYLDTDLLEFSLDELANGLGMALPEGTPSVERQRVDFCTCNMIRNTEKKAM